MIGPGGHSAIGLHFDQRCFRAVQLSRHHGQWSLSAAARVPRSDPSDAPSVGELKSLRGILGRQGFLGASVVLAMPTQRMLLGVVEVPPRSSGAPTDEIARAELARVHDYTPGAIEATCWELPPSPGSQTPPQALALACPHTASEPLLDLFEEAGFDVAALDGEMPAVLRACAGRLASHGITGILDIGWTETGLSLLADGQIIYHRQIADAGIANVAGGLAEKLEVDDRIVDRLLAGSGGSGSTGAAGNVDRAVSDALEAHWRVSLTEMAAPLSYVAHQYASGSVAQLLLAGYMPSDSRANDFFSVKLNCPVHVVRPRDLAPCTSDLDEKATDSSLTTAVGLASFRSGGML